ncbi:uncharacterized protein LOC122379391 [Amphibalanus amphitrite]|uniref:uncharacterized protein LOC122379391 n=1 Tax=Amphibalanus amphitrite TaxID=1232801 RepID=UPI001C9298C7|nr:uncharacterized protein LOC122379391 [Amphibalanus amphitrite]
MVLRPAAWSEIGASDVIEPQYRKYLGFQYGGSWWVWCCLPFGLQCSPFYFHKCIRAVVKYLRDVKSLSLMAYVDDFYLCSTKASIDRDLGVLLETLSTLGLAVNFEKSHLTPSESVTYLGFEIRCATALSPPVITVPKCKVRKLKQDISRALKRSFISARLLARIAGRCISMLAAVFPAKLKLRNVYRLLNSRSSWEARLLWSPGAREDLSWWVSSLDGWNGRLLVPPAVCELQLSTDASGSGWGAVLSTPSCQLASGFWDQLVSRQSANYRELLAVYFALRSFRFSIVGKTVEVLSDNVTTVAHINKFGSSNVSLDSIAQNIWSFAFDNNVSLVAHHIAGVSNTGPDTLSRMSARHEWVLHPSIFRQLDRMFGPHTVDRFAAVGTALLPTYNSRFADPCSSGVDALGQTDWGAENNWVNPPFRLIPRVLDVIEAQRADATLIAPMWPGQPWMARLRRLCTAPPIRLPPVTRSCLPLSEQQRIEPHQNRRWTLCAWRISGAHG